MATREVLRPSTVWDPRSHGFSQGIAVQGGTRMIFAAGQTALDRNGKVTGRGDIVVQTRTTLENLKSVLEAGGASLKDVVRITTYLTDMRNLPSVQRVRAEFFPVDPPASAIAQIVRLVHDDLLIEIDAIAVV
jgi:enamine deaminase RidA (YjgF/YER057c/UK114 family)